MPESGYTVQLVSPEGDPIFPVISSDQITSSDGQTFDLGSMKESVDSMGDTYATKSEVDAVETVISGLGGTYATKTELDNLASQISSAGGYVSGIYIGDRSGSRLINLGFTPTAVFAVMEGIEFRYDLSYSAALAVTNQPAEVGKYIGLEIESGGFIVHEISNAAYRLQMNSNNVRYLYIAFR